MTLKNFSKIGKWNWLKIQNTTYRDALITKNYILSHQNMNFSDQNFFVRKCEKNFFKIGKWDTLKMHSMTHRDELITRNCILAHKKIIF